MPNNGLRVLSLQACVDDSDRELLVRADELRRREFLAGLSPANVRSINREQGVDFATALLYTHFVAQLPDDWFAADEGVDRNVAATIAIVPGAFHREYPHLGSGGRIVAELAAARGWGCETLPIDSLGSLDENAEAIIRWFDSHSASDLIMVTISKGAADLKVALAKRPDLWNRVRAWICVSGILRGTPIANWLLDLNRFWLTVRCVLWYWNLPRSNLNELRCEHQSHESMARLTGLCIRPRRQADESEPVFCNPIQIVGFPLRRHLSSWRSRLWHRRFQHHGPNDGVIWLADLLMQPTTVVPIWGADHYMRTSAATATMLAGIVTSLNAYSSPRDASPTVTV